MGSWILYGLGTENENLPGFITVSPPTAIAGPQAYGSAFLPAVYQGTAIGSESAPLTQAQIRHIRNPETPLDLQRQQLDFIQTLNREHLKQAQADAQLEGVIESYELAFRMQAHAPEAVDLSQETEATRRLYASPEWGGRFIPRPSLDDVVRGALGLARDEVGYNATFWYPRQGGIE